MKQMTAALLQWTIGVFLGFGWTATAIAEADIYDGEFSLTSGVGSECAEFFMPLNQTARVFFVGPTGRTMVLNLVNDNQGPLHGLNLFGLYGTGDFEVERTIRSQTSTLVLTANGFVDREFILFSMTIRQLSASQQEICSATADFTGFTPKGPR
jgi:hypothetical protein